MRIRTCIAMAAVFVSAPVITISARAQDMCASPEQSCGRLLSPICLERLGAGSQGAGTTGRSTADCDNQFATYRECLATVAATCGPQTSPVRRDACPPETENRLWDAVKDSDDPQDFTIFLEACPDSPFARLASRRIQSLTRAGATQTPSADAAINLPAVSPPAIQAPTVSAPTPSNRPASGGFQLAPASGAAALRTGLYFGKSTNLTVGGVGDTRLKVISIDPASRDAEATLAWSNGLFGQGPLRGRLLDDGWLILSGSIGSGVTGQWTIEVKIQPPTASGAVFGEYFLTPQAGNPNGDQTGRFELRYANQP